MPHRHPLMLVATLSLLLARLGSAAAPEQRQRPDAVGTPLGTKANSSVYIVQLAEEPVVTYEGGIAGLTATKPNRGEKINPNNPNVVRYVQHLDSRHSAVLNAFGGGVARLYDYRYSFNGFAARLTPTQAAAIKAAPGVLSVEPESVGYPATENTPSFLGLTAPGGLWEQLGGQAEAGEDVVVGILDTGIWPEHPSFSDQSDFAFRAGSSGKSTLAYGPPPPDWYGACDSGEQFSQDHCNNKLVGARFFRLGAGAAGVITDDYLSPRDKAGHGTHTASTAAGNGNVPASISGMSLGTISGMAPRARIAAYKVCWNNAGCYLSDVLAGIDAAVRDGVDVINFSIGFGPSLAEPYDIAFLFAADAGVVVAAAAGNSGPGGQVGAPATVPWVTAVGASTHSRAFQGTVTLGDGRTFTGASLSLGTAMKPLVDAVDAGSELCFSGALDPAVVNGKIVLCKRGDNDRVDKSLAVAIAGGAGMILYNQAPDISLETDTHSVPTVHLSYEDGIQIKAYIGAKGASATAMLQGAVRTTVPAPVMADFSSRGPNEVAPDIIKPDVSAPGVDVLAGAPTTSFSGDTGEFFVALAGTSMASPHVAGVGALLRQLHPDWTPAMVKSALMTSAHQDVKKEDGTTLANPFDMGAGHIAPNPAADPGLVYNAGFADYVRFLCGAEAIDTAGSLCTRFGTIDPSDLNLASIGIAELHGVQTVIREVTNAGPAGVYNVSLEAPPGVDVSVEPASLTLAAGESATYRITVTTQSAPVYDQWTFGSLTWSHGPHHVRSPIAVRPVPLSAPAKISGTGTSGQLSYGVIFGYTGDFSARPHGLIPAAKQASKVLDDPANDIDTALATCDFTGFPARLPSGCVGINWHAVEAPAGTRHVRVSLFDNYTDGQDDLDVYVFDGALNLLGSSVTPTSAEEVNVPSPTETRYYVAVHGWQTDGPDATYTLFSWALTPADAGNMVVSAPSSTTAGGTGTVMVTWSGLAAGEKYLGSVTHHGVASPAEYTDALLRQTLVRVDTDQGVPQ